MSVFRHSAALVVVSCAVQLALRRTQRLTKPKSIDNIWLPASSEGWSSRAMSTRLTRSQTAWKNWMFPVWASRWFTAVRSSGRAALEFRLSAVVRHSGDDVPGRLYQQAPCGGGYLNSEKAALH